MDEASLKQDYERAASFRDRLTALSHIQSRQGINPKSVKEADIFAAHQDAGQTCIQVFFFRNGNNWGNRAYFPRADRSVAVEEVLESFVAQFYDDKLPPKRVLLSHDDPGAAPARRGLVAAQRPQDRRQRAHAGREARAGGACARQRPRGAGAAPGQVVVAGGDPGAACRAVRSRRESGTDRSLRQQPYLRLKSGWRHDRRGSRGFHQRAIPKVQYEERGPGSRR